LYEKAKDAFIQALSLAYEPAEKQRLSQEIIKCQTQQAHYDQASIRRLQNGEYYNRRPPNFSFYSISEKLAKIQNKDNPVPEKQVEVGQSLLMSELVIGKPVPFPILKSDY